ncbi:hypothetical protein GSI_12069 [Ganoderma sinense ZZ0214-1]|uniref:Integrase catalytic domain-containing protein n=1 Tax=Ganoderma sinense ZZ0214-1 TaxID=1077348 RepID=A0A2G8RXR9_9APHY|nr:hypothetical protein GSI_12069 [Ganoderma sinense ZZ0214-1]
MPSQSHPIDYRRASKPFELIHVDLKSFPVPSYHKYQHEILLYDDYSSYTWSISLRTKDNALQSTRQWFSYVETQYGAKVIKWKSDSGGELKSHAFTNMLKDKGIEIIPSAPHIHQQNGRAERIIRTLMDKSEAMRHDACIPQSWWEFSFEHAAHLHNRTPTRRLEWRTPYELLNGTKPDISHLRVFGCGAYVFLPPEVRKNKLSPKSELMIYLGVGAVCFQNAHMKRSDKGSRVRPNQLNLWTRQLLLLYSLMTAMSHAVLPQNLPQRARVRRETSHLHQLRLYPLYLLNLAHSAERTYQKCNTLCRRNLLRLTGQARKNRDGLRESGKYQFAKAMSMVNYDTLQTFLRTLRNGDRGNKWLRSAERNPPVPIPPSMRTHREPTPVISSSSSDDEEEEDKWVQTQYLHLSYLNLSLPLLVLIAQTPTMTMMTMTTRKKNLKKVIRFNRQMKSKVSCMLLELMWHNYAGKGELVSSNS